MIPTVKPRTTGCILPMSRSQLTAHSSQLTAHSSQLTLTIYICESRRHEHVLPAHAGTNKSNRTALDWMMPFTRATSIWSPCCRRWSSSCSGSGLCSCLRLRWYCWLVTWRWTSNLLLPLGSCLPPPPARRAHPHHPRPHGSTPSACPPRAAIHDSIICTVCMSIFQYHAIAYVHILRNRLLLQASGSRQDIFVWPHARRSAQQRENVFMHQRHSSPKRIEDKHASYCFANKMSRRIPSMYMYIHTCGRMCTGIMLMKTRARDTSCMANLMVRRKRNQ